MSTSIMRSFKRRSLNPRTASDWTTTRSVQTQASVETDHLEKPESEPEQDSISAKEQAEMKALLTSFETDLATRPAPTPKTADIDRDRASTPAPKSDPLTLQTLLRPSTPSGAPTLSDLDSLRPKPFNMPVASSPTSHRIIYNKIWTRAHSRLDSAFKKIQLMALVSQLDLNDKAYRDGIKGKKQKWWKPKKVTQMSKRDLCHAIMVLRWGMKDPDTLPTPRVGPQIVDTLPLSDRTLFLLLSPHSTVIRDLGRQLGLKLSFLRDPKTQVLSLGMHGSKDSVVQGKAEVEGLAESSYQSAFALPSNASTLRPEVYQHISRLTKTFLEPGAEPNQVQATTVSSRALPHAERLLHSAFVHANLRTTTPLYASIPSTLHPSVERRAQAMSPFAPGALPPWTAGNASTWARIRDVGRANVEAHVAGETSTQRSPFEELLEWSERTGMGVMDRIIVNSPQTSKPASSPWDALTAPFSSVDVVEDAKWSLRAEWGHVLWPLYAGASKAEGELGPIIAGTFGLDKLRKWRGRSGATFLSSAPHGFLATTGVLTPPTGASPFSAILSVDEADDAELSAQRDLENNADLLSTETRRVVYRPVDLSWSASTPTTHERIELVFEDAADVNDDVENSKCIPSRVIGSRVNVMVPGGSDDVQLVLERQQVLERHSIPSIAEMKARERAPDRIVVGSRTYMLDTDRFIRSTRVTPPAAQHQITVDGNNDEAGQASPPVRVQETFHDRPGGDNARGTAVYEMLAEQSGGDLPSLMQREAATWRKVLDGLEKQACASDRGSSRRIDGPLGKRVFSAGR